LYSLFNNVVGRLLLLRTIFSYPIVCATFLTTDGHGTIFSVLQI